MTDRDQRLRQLKLLVRRYHPDRCPDPGQLDRYTDLTQRLNAAIDELEKPGDEAAAPPAAADYELYRTAVDHYRAIHPDRLYQRGAGGRMTGLPADRQAAVLASMAGEFRRAQQGFLRLVAEHPRSVWAADAADKLRLLARLEERYGRFTLREPGGVLDHRAFLARHGLTLMGRQP